MEKKFLPNAAELLSKKRRSRRWQKVVVAMAAAVVFCTTYALILPAITEEHDPICGLEEHTHTDECCLETQQLVCGLEETEGHVHGDDCWEEETTLVCGREETEGHVHSDECYAEQAVLLCSQEESDGHVHDDGCYDEEGTLTCGLEEAEGHTHSDDCWGTEQVLTCGLEEQEPHTHTDECLSSERRLICALEEQEAHTHTDACYEISRELICEQEEHVHTEECYAPVEDEPESDPTADVETQADWESTLRDVTLTGEWPQDLLAVAESQLGYTESSRNFEVGEDGRIRGYTRYGAWYGDPYGDWCAMFVSFCLHYAEVENFPQEANCQRWIEALKQSPYNLYRDAHPEKPEEDWIPSPGELIFFDWESGEEADHVGIVAEYIEGTKDSPAQVKALEGNSNDRVQYVTYEVSDSRIMGYAELPEQVFYCGVPGHVHGAACRNAAGSLVCGLEAHSHTEACAVEQPSVRTLTAVIYEDGSYTGLLRTGDAITVTGILPADAEVRAYPVQPETDGTLLCAYDIAVFLPDGTLFQPEENSPLEVTIQSAAITDQELGEEFHPVVYFVPEDGEPERLETTETEDGVAFDAEHFSVYAVLAVQGTQVSTSASLKAAISSGDSYIQLTENLSVSETLTLPANTDITLDLNGHTLTASGTVVLFTVPSGTSLTIVDSQQPAETVTAASGSLAGNTASLSNGTLTYYVTTTSIINSATGATRETLEKHTVSTAGSIVGGSQPVFQVTGGTLNLESGMIRGGTGRAIVQTGGTTNLSGGYICGFTQSSGSTDNTSFGGAIKASGGTISLTGSVLAGNIAHNGGAIYATGSTKLSITGGVISGNTANRTTSGWNDHSESGAYRCGGGGIYADGNAEITMSGGFVTNNLATHDGYFDGGGGVCLSGTSSMALSGGYVTGNQAQGGGGIRTDFGKETTFVMTGGFVASNEATHAEGGGIAIDRNGTGTVTGGHITNNTIPNTGHWGGGGLFCADGSTLNLKNALITENTAGGFGAGVAGCPTGKLYLYVTEGCAIFDNRDSVDGDSPHFTSDGVKQVDKEICTEVFQSNGHADYFCALNSTVTGTMLGNNAANWQGSADYQPVIADAEDLLSATEVMGLQAHPTEAGKSAAQTAAKVYINGNYSYTHGGGIMCNGNLVIGVPVDVEVPARIELQASKTLTDSSGNTYPLQDNDFSFKVTMTDLDGTVIASGTCDASGKISFDHQLTFKQEGTFVYYVYEMADESNTSVIYDPTLYRLTMTVTKDNGVAWYGDTTKYTYSVSSVKVESSKDGETWTNVSQNTTSQSGIISLPLTSGTTFSNHLITPTKVTVQKKWEGGSGTDSVTVILKQDGTEKERQTLNAGNKWTYTWNDLEAGHAYTVEEVPVDGYTASYEVTTSTDDSGSTSLGQGSWWVPATDLSAGKQYLIVSPDGTKALYIASGNEGQGFDTADVMSVTQQQTAITINGQTYSTWYKAADADIPARSIYNAESLTRNSHSGIILKRSDGGSYPYLRLESNNNNYLKGASTTTYASFMAFDGIYLRGHNASEWTPDNLRTVIYADGKFNTTTEQTPANAAKLYTLVTGEGFTGSTIDSTTVVITNTKEVSQDFVLPETGGAGTDLYTMGGPLLTAAAGSLLLYRHLRRRKEDYASS